MNAPMDVRAVLDVAASWLPYDGEDNRIRERFAEACAAVAELIDADREFDAAEAGLSHHGDGPLTKRTARYNAAQKRRDAALAIVGGDP